jgi:hypothetical protein
MPVADIQSGQYRIDDLLPLKAEGAQADAWNIHE